LPVEFSFPFLVISLRSRRLLFSPPGPFSLDRHLPCHDIQTSDLFKLRVRPFGPPFLLRDLVIYLHAGRVRGSPHTQMSSGIVSPRSGCEYVILGSFPFTLGASRLCSCPGASRVSRAHDEHLRLLFFSTSLPS